MSDDKESRRNYDRRSMLRVMSEAKFRIAMSSFSEAFGAGILVYSINQMNMGNNNFETYLLGGAASALMGYSAARIIRAAKRYKKAKKKLDELDNYKGGNFHYP